MILPMRKTSVIPCMVTILTGLGCGLDWGILLRAAEPEPPIERLMELNSVDLFGQETSVKDGRVSLRFPGKGLFNRGFESPSPRGQGFVSNADEVKDAAARKVLMEGAKGEFTLVGRQMGRATSKFELADDFRISFRLRISNLPPAGLFLLTVNQPDPKNSIQTSFFQDLTVVEGGKKRRQVTSDKTYAAPPAKWFNQKSPGVPFEIVFKDKKLSITMTKEPEKEGGKEEKVVLITSDPIEQASHGRIVFEFRNMSFLMSDLVVEGKYDRTWAEAAIAKLKKDGKLKLKPPEAVAKEKGAKEKGAKEKGVKEKKPKEGEQAGGASSSATLKPSLKKKGSPKVDEPDPESGEDL